MKSKNRVNGVYKEGTKDWEYQYNMLLDDGITCEDCYNCSQCCDIFGQSETDTECQFYPNRFSPKQEL